MGLARSTYYDTPATEADTEIVARNHGDLRRV